MKSVRKPAKKAARKAAARPGPRAEKADGEAAVLAKLSRGACWAGWPSSLSRADCIAELRGHENSLAPIPRYRMHPTRAMNNDALSIGQVAARAGVNVQTLRYYERRGLLGVPRRSESGRRQYPIETIRVIRFIKRAQDLGFTLKEVEELIALRHVRGRDRAKVRRLAEGKLRDVDAKITGLRAVRNAVSTLVESCACRGESLECPILEALDDEAAPEGRRAGE